MNCLRSILLTCLSAGAFAIATTAAAQGIKVNGVTIPQSRIDLLVKSAASQGQADSPELRSRIRDELVTRELLAQEAAKRGMDKAPDFAAQLDMQRQGMLAQAYIQDYLRSNPVTEDQMRKEYEGAREKLGSREFKARHILVKGEDEAKQIIAQIKKGGNFEKIAAEKSEDTGSKGKGGDLDWSPAGRYVKPFADALNKLKKGQLTDSPVQTQFGYHIIRLDDERATKLPPYEEVKNNIQQQMQQQLVQKAIADLRAKAKIE